MKKSDFPLVASALDRLWGMIAPDVLELFEDGECDRDDVIEFTLDADRLETFFAHDQALLEEVKRFRELGWEKEQQFAKLVFTYKKYGY